MNGVAALEVMVTKLETKARVAAAYYNEENVSKFYRLYWGGSDIHIGRYDTGNETIAEASVAMTRDLLDRAGVRSEDRVLDIACGYGGTLRMLAKLGCRAKGIDISQVCVDEASRANKEAGLADKIRVEIGDFHAIKSEAETWDAVICQESLIHSTDRPQVFSEVYRVLRKGGVFAFSDILTAEGADIGLVETAFARLGAKSGATSRDYQNMAIGVGFDILDVEERLKDIRIHYAKLANLLAKPGQGLDPKAAAQIAKNIAHWETAIAGGHITWAVFVARKPT